MLFCGCQIKKACLAGFSKKSEFLTNFLLTLRDFARSQILFDSFPKLFGTSSDK